MIKDWGLALSGGGIKGAAHLGVLAVLEQEHLKPRMISGTSAGALVAALYASGLTPGATKRALLKLRSRDYLDYNWGEFLRLLASVVTLHPGIKYLPSGIFRGDKLHALVRELTDNKKLKDCRLPLAITAVDLDRGNLVVFTNMPLEIEDEETMVITDAYLADAVRASISIPVIFQPAQIGEQRFLDGGVRDILPLGLLKVMGAEVAVGVDLNDGLGRYHSPACGLIDIFTRTLDIMMDEISEEDEDLVADLIISPRMGKVKLYEYRKIPELMRAGEIAMRSHIKSLCALVVK